MRPDKARARADDPGSSTPHRAATNGRTLDASTLRDRADETTHRRVDYQVMPPLSAEEYAALKADIAEHGVRVPITLDQHGNIVDGHHRKQIADELGVPYDRLMSHYDTEEDARDAAFMLNLSRRHLSREQKRELIARELEQRPGDSDRAIARRLHVDHKTVGAMRRGGWGIPHRQVSREEAEQVTQQIRAGIVQWQQDILIELLKGFPPARLAAELLRLGRRLREEHGDEHDGCALALQVMLEPTVEEILRFPDSGWYADEARAVRALMGDGGS